MIAVLTRKVEDTWFPVQYKLIHLAFFDKNLYALTFFYLSNPKKVKTHLIFKLNFTFICLALLYTCTCTVEFPVLGISNRLG